MASMADQFDALAAAVDTAKAQQAALEQAQDAYATAMADAKKAYDMQVLKAQSALATVQARYQDASEQVATLRAAVNSALDGLLGGSNPRVIVR